MHRSIVLVPLALIASVLAVLVGATSSPGQPTVPPPTPVPPLGSPSPYPSVLETPDPEATPPPISAAAAALVDLDTGEVLYQRSGTERRPVASVTKIMTAMLVLERTSPEDVVRISENAASEGGATLGLEAGERISVRRLTLALMLQSANDAAVALAEHVSGGVRRFVGAMNRRARSLGLGDTRFASPNGLDDSGYSTASDLSAITTEAFRNETFREVVTTKFARIPSPNGPPRRVQNRNALLWLYPGAIGVKTGFTSAAGFCLVGAAQREGLRLAAVVLGAPSEAFSDTAAVLSYGFEAFERRPVVLAGERFDPITVSDRPVRVQATATMSAVLPRGSDVERRIVAARGLELPVSAGDRVGRVVVTGGHGRLGAVPLVAVEAVQEQIVPSWWDEILAAAGGFLDDLYESLVGG